MASKTLKNVEKVFIQHRRTSLRCDAWAAKAIRYRQAGDVERAERAEERTFLCLTRMKRLADSLRVLGALEPSVTLH
ncbi:MAG TPA: hypothetical protein VGI35_01905 [Steroidobacteraceae bacterium]|jgi:hypothetical protein